MINTVKDFQQKKLKVFNEQLEIHHHLECHLFRTFLNKSFYKEFFI